MKFTKNSGLVKIWVHLVLSGSRTLEEVPNLSNLPEIVAGEIKENEKGEFENE